MTLLLGLDIGTSSAKAVVFDPAQARVLAAAGHEYPIHRPATDRAEQNPDDWWHAAVTAARRALAACGDDAAGRVSAIGLSGQMHGGVLLDNQHKPVRPAIIWPDQRSAAYTETLLETVGRRQYVEIAGTLPAAGFMAVTLMWMADHEPSALRRTRCILLPKDYVRLQLTGQPGTDFSDAAATGLFDIAIKTWSAELVRAVGIARPLLPAAFPATSISGTLTQAAADALGLRRDVLVVMGSADQPAQAVGNGLITAGRGSVTVGSGGQVFLPIQPVGDSGVHLRTDPRVHIFNHAVPGLWYVLGATLSAGLSLRWLRDLFGMQAQVDAYSLLSAEAAAVRPGADGLVFLPYLTGERTPHMDASARGAFIGLTASHTRGHLARAIMEGVAFSLRQALDIAQTLGGTVETLLASGGGMAAPLWRGIMADVLGLPLHQHGLQETTAVGAALIAGVGTQVYSDFDAIALPALLTVTEPDSRRAAWYNERYTQFIRLYPTLRDDLHVLGQQEPLR